MHAEYVMRQTLDRLHPTPVPYIGKIVESDWQLRSRAEPGIREQRRLAKQAAEAERKRRDLERLGYEREIMRKPSIGGPTAQQITAAVAIVCQVPYQDFLNEKRRKCLVDARHLLAWELRYRKSWSQPRIGEYMGGKNHTTIGHSLKHVRKNKHLFADRIRAISELLDVQCTEVAA